MLRHARRGYGQSAVGFQGDPGAGADRGSGFTRGHRARSRARRPQGDRLPIDRHARRTRPAGARSRDREIPARLRPDPPGRRGDGGTRPGPHGAPHPGGPGGAHARDREPRRPLGRRGRRTSIRSREHARSSASAGSVAARRCIARPTARCCWPTCPTTNATACSRARSNAPTASTIVDVAALVAQLRDIRVRGYAQTLEELEEGLNAVAAPVRGADGQVVAALSVSGPAFRMRPVDLPRIARLTMEAAGAVSRRLGYVERGRTAAG